MNKTELATFAANHADTQVNVRFTDGTEITVELTGKLTTRGLAYRTDSGKVAYAAPTKIDSVVMPGADADGYTTAQVAALLNMEAKVLRVHLRAMGIGVGKGSRYTLSPADVTTIKEHLNA